MVNAFYENVNRHKAEGRELAAGEEVENLVLEFRPRPTQDMLIACLWSNWTGSGEPDLLSFAAITDEPPPEVAAAGHDRCIVPIKPEHIDLWLNPAASAPKELLDILEARERPYYEHRMACRRRSNIDPPVSFRSASTPHGGLRLLPPTPYGKVGHVKTDRLLNTER